MNKSIQSRVSYLDNLRAMVMLLGAFAHALLPYTTSGFYFYPLHAQHSYLWANYAIYLLHCTMMPTFYLLSGYFANLLIQKKGINYFINERLSRIGIPFIIALLLLIPYHFYCSSNLILQTFLSVAKNTQTTNGAIIFRQGMLHAIHNGTLYHIFSNPEAFWFLYYLLIFCALSLFFKFIPDRVKQIFTKILSSPYRLIIISILLSLSISVRHLPYIDIPHDLTITLQPLLSYGLFFILGWHYYTHPLQLKKYNQYPLRALFIAIISMLSYLCLLLKFSMSLKQLDTLSLYLINFVLAITLVSIAHAWLACYASFLNVSNALWQYLAKISYWAYLIRLPALISLQYFLINTSIPLVLQILLATCGAIIISIISFELIMKISIVNQILSGQYQIKLIRKINPNRVRMNH